MHESKPIVLQSLANPTVKRLVRMRDNRFRRRSGRLLVDGWRETASALRAGLELESVYLPVSPSKLPQERPTSVDNRDATACDAPVQASTDQQGAEATLDREPAFSDDVSFVRERARSLEALRWVTPPVMAKICYGQSPRGVVAEFHRPDRSLAHLTQALASCSHHPLVLILDRIEKPGNVGAVFRSADAAGVDAVLLCQSGDPFNPNAIRSSQGAVFHVPWAEGSESALTDFLQQHHIVPFAARVESSRSLWETDLTGPSAIILGNEAIGIGNRWQTTGEHSIQGVRIPMGGKVDSLNVAITAAVIVMEAQRQRLGGSHA